VNQPSSVPFRAARTLFLDRERAVVDFLRAASRAKLSAPGAGMSSAGSSAGESED
jgi:hypothetical protein